MTRLWRTHCVNLAVVRLRASRCIWANRRPGKVRNAPIREQRRARISLKVSLDIGPLWKENTKWETTVVSRVIKNSWRQRKQKRYQENTDFLLTGTLSLGAAGSAEHCRRSLQNLEIKKRLTVTHWMGPNNQIVLWLTGPCSRTWSTNLFPDQTPGSFRWQWE